jgi:hypothetical protein
MYISIIVTCIVVAIVVGIIIWFLFRNSKKSTNTIATTTCVKTIRTCVPCSEGTLYVEGVCVDDTQVCTGEGAVGGECGDKTTAAGTAYKCDCKEGFVCNTTTHLCEECPEGTLYVEGVCVDDTHTCGETECGDKTTAAGTAYTCNCGDGLICNGTVCEACPEGTLWVDGVCKDDKQTCIGEGAVGGECGDKTTAAGTAYTCNCKEGFVCNTTTHLCEACPAGTLWVDGVCKDDKQTCIGEGAEGGECGVEKTTDAGTVYVCECEEGLVCNDWFNICR